MVQLVITHGRSHEFNIPSLTQRPLEEAIRWGLERVGSPAFAVIPISLAFYGDYWRPDAGTRSLDVEAGSSAPTELQRQVAGDILLASGSVAEAEPIPRVFGWDTLNGLATVLDQHLHSGDLMVRLFLDDVESYFGNDRLRSLALDRVEEAIQATGDDVILLGHSLGSVVVYDLLRERAGLPVRALITLGSPLGLPTVRRRLTLCRFPNAVERWVNVFDPRDFVTGREKLREHFPSEDGRVVEDLETEGRSPSLTNPIAPHDGIAYLSSIALGTALGEMINAADAGRSSKPAHQPERS
jgi:hypothetical protein